MMEHDDWDSLRLDKEPSLVAGAAATFTYIPFMEGVAYTPTLAEARAFVEEYEATRGMPFTTGERETLKAAMMMILAYGARCEHSLVPYERAYLAESRRAMLALYRDSIGNFMG